jgi:hypothetical protein
MATGRKQQLPAKRLREETLRKRRGQTEDRPWGINPDKRGATYHDHAVSLAERFLLGVRFEARDFDSWAVDYGLLSSPPHPRSPEWASFVYARNKLISRLRKAAKHSRMAEEIGNSFDLSYNPHSQKWMLMPSDEAIARQLVLEPVEHYLDSERNKFWELAQGADLVKGTRLHERAINLDEEFDLLKETIKLHVKTLSRKIERQKHDIQEELRRRHQNSRGVGHNRRVRVMIDAEALLEAADD